MQEVMILKTQINSSQAYYLRDQDTWTKIQYKEQAQSWMKPLNRGKETGLVEIPANWYTNHIQSSSKGLTRYLTGIWMTFHR